MKNILVLSCFVLFAIGCDSDGELAQMEVGSGAIASESELKYSGTFYATDRIEVSGDARIYKSGDKYQLSLDEFSVSSGPDLKVYLSTSASPSEFINLGALETGTQQLYDIPPGVDFSLYSHVLIHCQQYNHLYAVAPLEENR